MTTPSLHANPTTLKPMLNASVSQTLAIALVEPRIPQNFGNIARLAACTGCPLLIIGDTGFSMADKDVRRSGMDYMEAVDLRQYPDLPEALEDFPGFQVAFLSSHAGQIYTKIDATHPTILVFGSESTGLPKTLLAKYPEQCYTIPMIEARRSLNLSSSVSLVVYDGLRQRNHWPNQN